MDKSRTKIAILGIEPQNPIALDVRSSANQLSAELSKVHERSMARSTEKPINGTVRYRIEEDGFSWRIEAEDFLGDLCHGKILPALGIWVANDIGDPIVLVEHIAGLAILAGDLEFREEFDPRRIYITKSANDVVWKRTDPKSGKPILWSFRQSMEISVGVSMIVDRTDRTAKPVANSGRKMNQKNLSAWVISRKPDITGDELTDILRTAFPSASISHRHGPHYLSLSRNGGLPEASEDDPRTWNVLK